MNKIIVGLVVVLFFSCVQAESVETMCEQVDLVEAICPQVTGEIPLCHVKMVENFEQDETSCEKLVKDASCEDVLSEGENKGFSFAFVVAPEPVPTYTVVEEVVETVSQPVIEDVIEEFEEIVEIEVEEDFFDDFDIDDLNDLRSMEESETLDLWTKIKLGLLLGKIKLIKAKDTTLDHVVSHKEKYLIGALLCAGLSTAIVIYLKNRS